MSQPISYKSDFKGKDECLMQLNTHTLMEEF